MRPAPPISVSDALADTPRAAVSLHNAAGLLCQTALSLLEERSPASLPRLAVFHAWPHPLLADLARQCKDLRLWQHRRSLTLDLHALGLTAAPLGNDAAEETHGEADMALVLAVGQRMQSLGWAAAAIEALRPDGLLLFCAPNELGARGYDRRIAALAPRLDTRIKAKSRCIVFRKSDIRNPSIPARWREEARPKRQPDSGLWTQPGVFGWERTDAGSALLAAHMPRNLAGFGMDLGCGTGILACHAVRICPAIAGVHLVDDDALALDCARRNLNARIRARSADMTVHIHWLDATRDTLPGGLDWALLNPPFHAAGRRNTELGQRMIQAACHSLRPGGRLLMVANRKLPYENVLNASLRHWRTLHEGDGFKAIEGFR